MSGNSVESLERAMHEYRIDAQNARERVAELEASEKESAEAYRELKDVETNLRAERNVLAGENEALDAAVVALERLAEERLVFVRQLFTRGQITSVCNTRQMVEKWLKTQGVMWRNG